MADLTTNFAGIRCPNPFWLASGPPTNCGEQVTGRAAEIVGRTPWSAADALVGLALLTQHSIDRTSSATSGSQASTPQSEHPHG